MTCSPKEDLDTTPTSLVWITFIDDAEVAEPQLVGACIVEVKRAQDWEATAGAAIKKAVILGIAPNGPAVLTELLESEQVHPTWFDTFLTRATIEARSNVEDWIAPKPMSVTGTQ